MHATEVSQWIKCVLPCLVTEFDPWNSHVRRREPTSRSLTSTRVLWQSACMHACMHKHAHVCTYHHAAGCNGSPAKYPCDKGRTSLIQASDCLGWVQMKSFYRLSTAPSLISHHSPNLFFRITMGDLWFLLPLFVLLCHLSNLLF